MARILRTRFAKDIIAEFLPPARPSSRVAIICTGAPSTPRNSVLMEVLAKKGYWTFYPRYRGSWESGGSFLKISPERDIKDILDQLPKGFTDAHDHKRFAVKPSFVLLVAGSFGGPAGILLSRDSRVNKVIAVSPVVEWRAPSKAEPLGWVYQYMQEGFGMGYRMTRKNWDKLKTGKFYNPMPHWKELDGKKLFIIHAKNDESVRVKEVIEFAKLTRANFVLLKTGGHLSSSIIMTPRLYPKIMKFLKQK